MVTDSFGVGASNSKIDAITQLSQPTTVQDVRILLGMSVYLRLFIPNYSTVVAPISDLLRDSRFKSKRARRLQVPWGESQSEAMRTHIKLLTIPPILTLPNWEKPFRLHLDTSQIGAGAVLAQFDD